MTIGRYYSSFNAPCCDATLLLDESNTKNSGRTLEVWTDGFIINEFSVADSSIARCPCDGYFFTASVDKGGARLYPDPPDLSMSGRIPAFVSDDELQDILQSSRSNLDSKLEFAIRLRLLRHLNEGYRDAYRACKKKSRNDFPSYTPSSLQVENIKALILMLEANATPCRILIAELYRQLGDFDKSLEVAHHIEEKKEQNMRTLLMQLIATKVCGPVRYWL